MIISLFSDDNVREVRLGINQTIRGKDTKNSEHGKLSWSAREGKTEEIGMKKENHFVDINKTISMPKSASKEIDNLMLTRYACYLIAQNGDPRKEQIAFAPENPSLLTIERRVLSTN